MAVVSAVVAAGNLVGGLLGGGGKDDERMQKNSNAYSAALSGDQGALLFLKARSGQYGLVNGVPAPWNGTPGAPLGGWATSAAQQDAANKYNAASAAIAGTPLANPAATSPTGLGDKVAGAISSFAETIGGAAGAAASSGSTGRAVQRVASTTQIVLVIALIAAVGFGGYYVVKHLK